MTLIYDDIQYVPEVIINSFDINHNDNDTDSLDVTLYYSVENAEWMEFRNRGTGQTIRKPFSADSTDWVLSDGPPGLRFVNATFGNRVSAKSPTGGGDGIIYVPYPVGSITLESLKGNQATTDSLVVNILNNVTLAQDMRFVNVNNLSPEGDEADWDNATSWEILKPKKKFSSPGLNGPESEYGDRFVAAQFRNKFTPSDPEEMAYTEVIRLLEVRDSIEYTRIPFGSFKINGGEEITTSLGVTLNMKVTNATEMRFINRTGDPESPNPDDWTSAAWVTYSTIKNWTLESRNGDDGIRTVVGQFKNSYGQFETTDSIEYLAPKPITGRFVINDDDEITLYKDVTLNINVHSADLDQYNFMRFKNREGEWSGWQSFSDEKSWMLTPSYGIKTVFGEFKNRTTKVLLKDSITLIKIPAPIITAIGGDSVVDVMWDAVPVRGINGYNVYRSLVQGTDYTQISRVADNAYRDLDVINDIPYYYVVTAIVTVDSAGDTVSVAVESDFSNETVAVPTRPQVVLDKKVVSFRGMESSVKVFWVGGKMYTERGNFTIKGSVDTLPELVGTPFEYKAFDSVTLSEIVEEKGTED